MYKSHQQKLREAIGNAADKKLQDFKLIPTTKDYEEVTGYLIELFTKTQGIYHDYKTIIPKLKQVYPRRTAIDRIGPEGLDEILSVLKEKRIITEHRASFVVRDERCRITSIMEDDMGIGCPVGPLYRYRNRK